MSEIPMTKKQLADVAGYTYRWLHDIDKLLPDNQKLFVQCEGTSKCDLKKFVQNWVDYNVSSAAGKKEAGSLEEVRARHEVVKTQKTELEVARLRRSLIDIQDVKALWATIANTVMQGLIHLPDRVAPLLIMMDDTKTISTIIEEEVRRVLENMRDIPLPDEEPMEEEMKDEAEESGNSG